MAARRQEQTWEILRLWISIGLARVAARKARKEKEAKAAKDRKARRAVKVPRATMARDRRLGTRLGSRCKTNRIRPMVPQERTPPKEASALKDIAIIAAIGVTDGEIAGQSQMLW